MKAAINIPPIFRIVLVLPLFIGLLSACGKSDDQKDDKVTVGIINLVPIFDKLIDTYKAGMHELGYVEGENITYIYNGPTGNIDAIDAEVQKILDAHVDLILSVSTPVTQVVKRMTEETQIPVVFLPITDPIGSGLVDDLSHPGGNMTGIMSSRSGGKQLEWLHVFVPSIKRIYIPYNSDDTSPTSAVQSMLESAKTLDIDVVLAETTDREAVLAALQDIPDDIDAILVVPDSVVGNLFEDIIAVANARKIPVAGTAPEQAELGALLCLGADPTEMGRQVARLSQQILKGIAPGDLPIEASEYYITLNLKAAEFLDITIQDYTLNLANKIIR